MQETRTVRLRKEHNWWSVTCDHESPKLFATKAAALRAALTATVEGRPSSLRVSVEGLDIKEQFVAIDNMVMFQTTSLGAGSA